MKQNLRFILLTLLCTVFSSAWGDTETIDFSEQGYSNQQAITTVNSTNFSVTFDKGTNSNAPKYFTNGTAIRVYGGNFFTVTSGNTITKIKLTFGESDGSNAITTDVVTYENGTWTGSANSVKFTVDGTTGNRRIQAITVTFEGQSQHADKYYVAGTWTNWATNKIEMTKKSDGTYTLANQQLVEGAQFKIIKVADESTVWYGGEGNDPNNNNPYWLTADNHTDISLFTNADAPNFYMPIEGTWTITVNPTNATLTVDGDWPVWEYYLKGDFNNWGIVDSYKFSQVGETSKFTLNKPIQLGEKFKIYGIRGSEEKWYGAVSNGDFYVEESLVGEELSLTTENGGEHFLMNLSNKKDYWELEFDPVNMTLVLGNYVSDVAELPFEYDGGRNGIPNTPGLTSSGLDTDYSSSPKLKFTAASNAVTLHFDERPGTLSFDIKRNPTSGTTISVFEVQASENGEDWTALETYDNLSTSVQSETFDNLGENVRYIKWVLKEKNNGNVALGNIKLEKYVAPQPHTLTINPVENGEVFVFYNDPDNNYPAIEDGDEVLEDSEVLVSVSVDEGYYLKSITVTDADGQNVTLTEEEAGISWTFIMPKSDVTVSCTVEEINYDQEEWVLTPLADLTEDDIFVIVGNNGDNYAMPNDKGTTPPDAVLVGVVQNKIITPVADRIKWNISGNATDGYIFYPNGDAENWLYLKDKETNKGVCVGTKEDGNNVFTIVDGYLYNDATERYVGIFNSADWRCYTSTGTNIAGQTFAFYKYVKPEIFEFSISNRATDGTDCYATISALGEGNWKVKGDVVVSTVVVENKVLTYPKQFVEGDVIPGDGAYLVKGAAGDYAFEKTKNPKEVDLGTNMLLSTGEGNFTTVAPTGEANNGNYYFYKLSLNKKSTPGSVGFYWGASEGAPFTYGKPKQAYLAVPKENAQNVQGFSFDGTTGITEVETSSDVTGEVYTISGVRVNGSNLSKGVYIVNGKKVIIK